MKSKGKGPKPRGRDLQELIDMQARLEATIHALQAQIEELETVYMEKTWQDGNVLVGWSKKLPTPVLGPPKIRISPKEKIFSLSSITSSIYQDLSCVADKTLVPIGEIRFETKKKKRIKKRNSSLVRRPRPIRKKRKR